MGVANSNWQRWIWASVCQYFKEGVDYTALYVEGTERDTREESSWLELRMDGPQYYEQSHNYWRLYLEINTLLQAHIDFERFYIQPTEVGKTVALFTTIPIYKYGSETGDDESFVGCLELIQNPKKKEGIYVYRLGQIEPKTKITQVVIEGHYEMFLTQ